METTRRRGVLKSQSKSSNDELERETTTAPAPQATSTDGVSLLVRRQRQLLTIDTRNVPTTALTHTLSLLQQDCAAAATGTSTGTERPTTTAGVDGWISSSTRAGGVGRPSFTSKTTDETWCGKLSSPIQESPISDLSDGHE